MKFGFNLTLGERRGVETDLVSWRSLFPGGFDNPFVDAEVETEISFEADIEHPSRVPNPISLAGLLETDSLPNTDDMLSSDSTSLFTLPFKRGPELLST